MRRVTPEQTPRDSGSTPLAARLTTRVLGLRETLASCTRNFPSPERIPRNQAVLNGHLSPKKLHGEFHLKSTAMPQRLLNLMRISSLPKSLLRVLSAPLTSIRWETLPWTGTRMIVTSILKETNSQIRNKSTLRRQSGNALFPMMRRWFSILRSLRSHRNHRKLSHYKMMPCWEAPFVRHSLAPSFPRRRNDFVTPTTTRKLCAK